MALEGVSPRSQGDLGGPHEDLGGPRGDLGGPRGDQLAVVSLLGGVGKAKVG